MSFEKKIKLFNYLIIFFFLLAIVKLFQLQILDGSYFKRLSFKQSYQLIKNIPNRGSIYSSDNYPITSSLTMYQLSLYKPNMDNFDQTKQSIIQSIIDIEQSDLTRIDSFFQNPDQLWITLKTLLNQSQSDQLADQPGLIIEATEQRFYPENDLFSDILGILAKNKSGANTGYGGLEGYYNQQIEGKAGFLWKSKDAIGKTVFTNLNWKNPKIDGFNLYTFLNRDFQYILDQELSKGLLQTQAESITAIIMDSYTGSILAMVSKQASPSATQTNYAISHLYEPGSIFKPLILSIGLESQSINNDFICQKCDQDRYVDGYQISNWDLKNHPNSNLLDIIKNSDNIGMTYVMDQIDLDTFLEYAYLLGLNKKTGIDLQGESKPNFDKNFWSQIEKATASFGQGFAITPIQMIQAFNTIATDGQLISPRVVNYLDNSINKKNTKLKSVAVFNKKTTDHIKKILEYGLNYSNLAKLNTNNLSVCGKSGTAQVASQGAYGQDTIASFIGFSPCQKPKYTMLVVVRMPKSSPWGASTAAPVWFNIANKMEFFIKVI